MCTFEKNIPAVKIKLEVRISTFILQPNVIGSLRLDTCQNVPQNLFTSCFGLPLHETVSSTMLLVMKKKMKKRRRNIHVSLQPAVISNISISSLWWHREDSTFSGVIDVTQQQQLRSFAVRAAGLAASVCGRAALLLEVKFLTSHQSKGGLASCRAAR